MRRISVLGAGAFGTALAIAVSREHSGVLLWGRSAGQIRDIEAAGENAKYLPGQPMPSGLDLSFDLEKALASPVILLAIPMQKTGSFLAENAEVLAGKTVVACCKGVDLESGLGPASLLEERCPGAIPTVLTGPSFAVDIAAGLPTALTLAIEDLKAGAALQAELSTKTLRLYLTDDLKGAELGGAMKNVVALVAGLTMGTGLGESARAAVITRGFAEMQRFADRFGSRPETLMGLSGLGDLILTCTSEKSRNYAAGIAIGRGETPASRTTEGIATAKAVWRIAKREGIDMPLTQTLTEVLSGNLTLQDAIVALLSRPLKKE
ncbi:MAG: NAD(P)-dependent glycerol-3-phosphate dehydrogenase [Alphaproteobacteria bacterium]|nr:NAD(P)-dependent glycerol-3-phosphate dehydrogenase [Alphaproteobacteria bacterium]NNF24175.1 NAD(P)-dependent glycerol-3-phosphate dehydrogenase [Paracoccaceae bacterium]